MLIGDASYTVVVCGVLVVAGIALLVVIRMLDSRWRNHDVPKARVVTRPGEPGVIAAKARPLVRLAAALGVLVGGAAALFWLHGHHTDMIIVTESGSAVHAERYVQLGAPHELPLAHVIHLAEDRFADGEVWIFNETQRTLRLEDSEYGPVGLLSFSSPKVIPAGTMDHTRRVDYIGPDDVPPKEITVSEGDVMATRTWLTWER